EFIGSPSHLCFTLHNVLLGSLRVLANFVTLCNAQCCVIPNKNTPGGLSNGERCPDLKLPSTIQPEVGGPGPDCPGLPPTAQDPHPGALGKSFFSSHFGFYSLGESIEKFSFVKISQGSLFGWKHHKEPWGLLLCTLWGGSDLRLLRGIPDSWSVGVSVTELVLGRLGILSFPAGLALVSMTALLQPCIMTKTKCQKIFNKEICSYKVVEQNDPERTCIVL
ncbi:beta-microseminoprotein, partial [Neofelis nebulosa]|uniref:beta-microseminoprotein n=1 Tax=Neofelis nebulosa TaxID=61452 RepID=UPI00272CAD68